MGLRKKDDIYNEPIRAGNRGGQGLFNWEAVKVDKQSDHYLGNTVRAAHGRWQKNRDLGWYHSEKKEVSGKVDTDEIAEIKRMEAEAMGQALGLNMRYTQDQAVEVEEGIKRNLGEHQEEHVNYKFQRAQFSQAASTRVFNHGADRATPQVESGKEPERIKRHRRSDREGDDDKRKHGRRERDERDQPYKTSNERVSRKDRN